MDRPSKSEKTASKRNALSEIQPRSPALPQNFKPPIATSSKLPHHESLKVEGNLSIRERSKAKTPVQVIKANPLVVKNNSPANKRDSQASTTSTASATRARRKTHVGPWQLGKTLGKGATGRVRLAKHAVTGQTAAIKIVSKKSAAMVQSASMAQMDKTEALSIGFGSSRTMPFGIEREIVIMKLITHPNVTTLYDIWENRGELYLVLEYVEGGELFEYVSRNGALPESEAVRLFRQIIAGLSYCHRFHICHRDLKPENILLDKNRNIKLADFGMAALQPSGKYLTTSCGSPHYAAPEIILGKQYRGDRADIWSVGIILFAMLNGFLPFDGGDLPSTLRLVKKGDYYLPPNLTPEASDLIQRILQKRPEKRISMDEIWKHPLIKKYEKLHATLAAPMRLVGPSPPLTPDDCGRGRIRRHEIDKELLRNLQTLWHGEKQEELISRLMSEEPNHEKLFYWALVKFRNEQLENYSGEPLQYSSSDHHHASKPISARSKCTGKGLSSASRYSQFSIISGDSRKQDHYYKNPAVAVSKTTQSSYDPYRSSHTPIVHKAKKSTVVVTHLDTTREKGEMVTTSVHGAKTGPEVASTSSVQTFDSGELEKLIRRRPTTFSTVSSKNTIASSKRAFRKSASSKRNVNFQHRRQKSTSTASARGTSSRQIKVRQDPVPSRPQSYGSNQTFSDSKSTPSMPKATHPVGTRLPSSDLDLQKTRIAASRWKEESRKVSAELGKICEEAFNRSAVSSTSEFSQQFIIDTPATTISIPPSVLQKSMWSRHLPMTPILRELIERRQEIIESWGDADPKTLADIVETLDRRIIEVQNTLSGVDRRVASDPTHIKPQQAALVASTMADLTSNRGKDTRAASDPLRSNENSIRLVTPDPVSPMAKLNARKNKAMPINSLKAEPLCTNQDSSAQGHHIIRNYGNEGLQPIKEHPNSPGKGVITETKGGKKWAWLSKKSSSSQEDLPPTPPRKNSPLKHHVESAQSSTIVFSNASRGDENEAQAVMEKKQRWFQKMFSKSSKKDLEQSTVADHKVLDIVDEECEFESTGMQSTDSVLKRTGQRGYGPATSVDAAVAAAAAGPIEISQNWFAKVFHLKPATSTLVLQISKVRARSEITKILREWKKFGLQDVVVEKRAGNDVVRGRVDVANYLHIKPVSFFANFYIVLERGRKTNISIAKFTQEKGAASSFYRVVETLESVLNEDELVLTNTTKRKAILKSMKDSGL